jgi:hypothetical protein
LWRCHKQQQQVEKTKHIENALASHFGACILAELRSVALDSYQPSVFKMQNVGAYQIKKIQFKMKKVKKNHFSFSKQNLVYVLAGIFDFFSYTFGSVF